MKQKKLLSLGVILLLTLSQLFAQDQSSPITLKSGDWFETGIRITNLAHTSDYNFNVRYDISKNILNGDLAVKVSIERMRLKYANIDNTWLGYDSYYPPYVENRKKTLTKQSYEITADSHGKISNLRVLSTAQKFNFSLISVKTNAPAPKAVFSFESIFSAIQVKKISELLITSLIEGKDAAKKLALLNTTKGDKITTAVFKSASFKLPTNAVIKGNVTNVDQRDSIYAVDKEILRFNKGGSFSADVLAGLDPRQRWIFGHFDEYKTFTVYLAPSDTLIVRADALNFDNTVSFAGNAAAKASLSKDLVAILDTQWVNKSNYRSKSLPEFLSFQKQGQKDFDRILNNYANRVPSDLLNFYIANFKYVQAGTKLQFFSHNRNPLKPNISLEEFPKDFFLSIDTLPVSMSGVDGGLYYIYYVTWLLSYNQTKLGMLKGSQYGFYTDFATSMASFEGYPLYYTMYNSFVKELHKSDLENTERLKNYYEDFINNCGDTTYTNRIKSLWAKARLWLPGNVSPVQKLLSRDGSVLDLNQFKGKPLVLIVNNNNPDVLKDHIALIKKQNGSQVHFVVAQRFIRSDWKIDQKLKDLTNVTYVELNDKDDNQRSYDLYFQQTKIFTFNSDFRVISGYLIDGYPTGDLLIKDPVKDEQAMRELIKKAVDSGIMTKEQKASLLKIIGWSVSSILFVSLIFFWIYKARIANLKRKESLKRQIKELEVKAIRSQMNPHFMFNALNSIQSLINNYQYKEANVYLEKFALLMRRVLNNSEKTFVTLSDELDAIRLYCELEQLRFNFKFEIEVSPEVNTQLMEIPGMIIQPLVENSILHGLAQKGDTGLLIVHIGYDQRYLKIVIKDNGTGLKENTADCNKSFGLKLVKERLMLLSADGNVGNLYLSSNLGKNENGVTAVLTIPID